MNLPPGSRERFPLSSQESAGLAEGRGHPAGGRGMAEMSVLGTAWSPAGREGVKRPPPSLLARASDRGVCFGSGSHFCLSEVSPFCPPSQGYWQAHSPTGRPAVQLSGAVSGAMGRENIWGWVC